MSEARTAAAPSPSTGGDALSPPTRRRALRILVVVLAIGQPVSSLVFDWLSPSTLQSGAEFSPIVPPGAWFAIWGVIIVLSIAWALAQVRPSTVTVDTGIRDRLAGPTAVGFVTVSRGSIVYAVTVSYALVGVGLSTAEAGLTALWITCIAGVSIVWASVIAIRLLDARHPALGARSTEAHGRAL